MALVSCVECSAPISDKALSCPKCGATAPHVPTFACLDCGEKMSVSWTEPCPNCGNPEPGPSQEVTDLDPEKLTDAEELANPDAERISQALAGAADKTLISRQCPSCEYRGRVIVRKPPFLVSIGRGLLILTALILFIMSFAMPPLFFLAIAVSLVEHFALTKDRYECPACGKAGGRAGWT